VVEPARVGLEILAFVRLRYPTGNYRPFHALLDSTPEVVEAHHVTGEDCFVLKVVARSMRHLEEITGRIAGLGSVTTSVVYSSPMPRRDLAVDAPVGGSPTATTRSRARAQGRRPDTGKPPVAN
jgi:Lrp/AsnC family leucine-responsive transcriptional regulator